MKTALSLCLALMLVAPASATTFTVTTFGPDVGTNTAPTAGSLHEALLMAQAGDTIKFAGHRSPSAEEFRSRPCLTPTGS